MPKEKQNTKNETMEKTFSPAWKRSVLPRKQRKYRYHAPLHLRQKMMQVHLAKPLREKYRRRQLLLHRGDRVKILRGQFSGKEAKVEKILLKKGKVLLEGMDVTRRDGSKVLRPFHPSALQIMQLELSDARRKKKVESMMKREIKLSGEPPSGGKNTPKHTPEMKAKNPHGKETVEKSNKEQK